MQTHADNHAFVQRPYRTLIGLSIPITLSLIAEPITGMVDTAFVAQLGAVPLAALGVGTTLLSTVFWIFNFLAISVQTEVAQALGREDGERANAITSLGLLLAFGFGLALMLIVMIGARWGSALLGASDGVLDGSVTYVNIRLLSAPAVLLTFVGLGALRGKQDMRTPMVVSIAVNVLNVVLDWLLIVSPFFNLGIEGAAIASAVSQWIGAIWTLVVVLRAFGFVPVVRWADVSGLLRIGGDLFVRTGALTFFILLATRVANQISPEAGAAHQALRTVFLFCGFLSEGVGVAAQSLAGYFLGAGRPLQARRAAIIAIRFAVGIGSVVAIGMLLGRELVIALFLPLEAVGVFNEAWIVAVLIQPITAVAFVTDGIHWGTGDYAYIRNAMLLSTLGGTICLLLINPVAPLAFFWVWIAHVVWLTLRAIFGVGRIWPGIGESPLQWVPTKA